MLDTAIDGTRTAPVTTDGGSALDACVPLDCEGSICGSPVCGVIGDGCGGTLSCGNQCPSTWSCERGLCRPSSPIDCVPVTCSLYGSFRYCGAIGDGCGGALDCACPNAGWTCEHNFCVGRPPVCTPWTCDLFAPYFICGIFDNGCGGTIDCRTCSQPGWICQGRGTCVGPPSCAPHQSCTGPDGETYCGSIGDGCGGTLQCGNTCASMGLACDNSICGGRGTPPPIPPPPAGAPSTILPPPLPPPLCVLPD